MPWCCKLFDIRYSPRYCCSIKFRLGSRRDDLMLLPAPKYAYAGLLGKTRSLIPDSLAHMQIRTPSPNTQ